MRWIAIIIILFFGGLIGYWHATENAGRYFVTDVGGGIIVITIAIWWISATSWNWKRKLAMVAAFGLLPICFKYDGSRSGSAAPHWTWRFGKAKDVGLDDLSWLNNSLQGGVDAWQPAAFHKDFTGFLGDRRDGLVRGFELEPDWEAHPPKELWRHRIGLGWSGFVVKGRYAITQEQREEVEMVTCYHLETGEPLWAHRNTTRFSEGMGSDGPRATPQIDGDWVYALGATGILDGLDLATGELKWSRNVLEEQKSDNLA